MPKEKKGADNFPVWDFGWFPVTIKNIAVDIETAEYIHACILPSDTNINVI